MVNMKDVNEYSDTSFTINPNTSLEFAILGATRDTTDTWSKTSPALIFEDLL